MKIAIPEVEQVRELRALVRMTAPAEWLDQNGHVNVQHYLGIYDRASWPLMHELGMSAQTLERDGFGLFDLEHHIWYLAEIHAGDVLTVHSRFIDRSAKRFRGVMFIVNESRERLASALEYLSTGADLRARRTMAYPASIAAALDRIIDEHRRLPWAAPACGAIAP